MNLIVFGLGANLGRKLENLRKAVFLLRSILGEDCFLHSSSVYESLPLTKSSAPKYHSTLNFYNACTSFMCDMHPIQILEIIKEVEEKIGRKSKEKWAPREIDIDILIYENNDLVSEKLVIPHAELHKRDFVILPLIEIFSSLGRDFSIFQRSFLELNSKMCIKKLTSL